MTTIIGKNIKVFDKEDHILIKISKDGDLEKSKTGRSDILASSGGFADMGKIEGFKNKDLGLNLLISVRDAKSKQTSSSKTFNKKRNSSKSDDEN